MKLFLLKHRHSIRQVLYSFLTYSAVWGGHFVYHEFGLINLYVYASLWGGFLVASLFKLLERN